jgi:hypothetical protein
MAQKEGNGKCPHGFALSENDNGLHPECFIIAIDRVFGDVSNLHRGWRGHWGPEEAGACSPWEARQWSGP